MALNLRPETEEAVIDFINVIVHIVGLASLIGCSLSSIHVHQINDKSHGIIEQLLF